MSSPPVIAVTAGEPAGIGPDLCVRVAERRWPARIVLVGDLEWLRERARKLGVGVRLVPYVPTRALDDVTTEVAHVPLAVPAVGGRLDAGNARAVIAMLDRAIDGCMSGEFAAMVTAPVQKSIINDAGIGFTGHTEYLAARTHAEHVVMMLAGRTADGWMRVALATTHLALSAVPSAVTFEGLLATLHVIERDLRARFGIARPRIAVCGLNPHAGESGYLGREEIDVIAPAIEAFRAGGAEVSGPLPADTIFVPHHARAFDCIVAMYHDQGLPPLKQASFGMGVNITLGLPIVRTSVDHGTALDLAADPQRARSADPRSLFAAVELAIELARSAPAAPPSSQALTH
ncbi:MAG TPA: 4-hydroxythreonine-4-phosphate dehydrogenase PdxA [Casimicrobiaceae bacterium]|jgi:4-hydroxythreonine-4-phosphate dehydrogenase